MGVGRAEYPREGVPAPYTHSLLPGVEPVGVGLQDLARYPARAGLPPDLEDFGEIT